MINQFGVLVSFISGLAHPIDASRLLVCKRKTLFNMRKTGKKTFSRPDVTVGSAAVVTLVVFR